MRQVIVPQAVSKVIPPLLNDFIALMKDTSLVGVLGRSRSSRRATTSRPRPSTAPAWRSARLMFLVVTIPLARLVDLLIARQQKRTSRGGTGGRRRRPSQPRAALQESATRGDRSDGGRADLKLRESTRASAISRSCAGIDLEVGKGEVVCVLGPSGSGKSTLLRCINLLEPPEKGEILLEGRDICKGDEPPPARRAGSSTTSASASGMVFQQFNLFPHKSALGKRHDRAADRARPEQGRGSREGHGAARARRPRRQAGRVPRPPLRRPAAARRDRPSARDGSRA